MILNLPLLPADRLYEDIRFRVLRPEMERVAVELTKAHPFDESEARVKFHVPLSFEYRRLSRGSTYHIEPDKDGR